MVRGFLLPLFVSYGLLLLLYLLYLSNDIYLHPPCASKEILESVLSDSHLVVKLINNLNSLLSSLNHCTIGFLLLSLNGQERRKGLHV